MAGLVCGEVARVDLALLLVNAEPRPVRRVLEQPNELRVRRSDPSVEFHGVALVVPAFRGDLVLVHRRQMRPILRDDPADALGEQFRHVGHVAEDFERRPLVEPLRAQGRGIRHPHDPRDSGRVVGEGECGVVVVAQAIHHTNGTAMSVVPDALGHAGPVDGARV